MREVAGSTSGLGTILKYKLHLFYALLMSLVVKCLDAERSTSCKHFSANAH
jgi:hypothetical protein